MEAGRRILLLVGPKGSGKTHVGALLERALGVPYVRVEAIFLGLAARGLAGPALEAAGFGRAVEAVGEALAAAGRACLDTTATAPSFPASLEALRALAPVTLVAVRAPPETCLARIRARDAAAHLPATEERIRAINEAAARVALPWDLVLENGDGLGDEAILAPLRAWAGPG
jgi:predicted kinase